MRVIDRYVYREVGPPLVLAVAVFTVFHLLDRLPILTDLVVGGVRPELVVPIGLYMVPSFLVHTLPMGVLFSILIAAGRLISDREVMAFQAAGVSPLRVFRPFLVVALAVSAATALLTLGVEPHAHAAFRDRLERATRARPATALRPRTFNQLGSFVIYADEVDPVRAALHGVLVADERDPHRLRLIAAARGRLLTGAAGGTVLELARGTIHESGGDVGERYRVAAFSRYDAVLHLEGAAGPTRWVERPEKGLGAWDLISSTRALEVTGDVARSWSFLVELHKRLAFPASAIVFAVVAYALAIRIRPAGRGGAVLASLAILVAYYLLLNALGTAARRGRLPAWAAAWTPIALFGAIGLALLRSSVGRAAPPVAVRPARRARRRIRGGGRRRRRSAPGSILDRHLLRRFLGYAVYGVATATALFLVVDLFETLDRYLKYHPPLRAVLHHLLLRLPGAWHRAGPFVTLFATIVLVVDLGRHHELTALKAAGLSAQRVAAPILLLVAVVSAATLAVQETLLPAVNARAEEVDRVQIGGEKPRDLQPRSRIWFRTGESRFVRLELVNPAARLVDGLTILDVDGAFAVRRRLDAARATWRGGGWQVEHGAERAFDAGGLRSDPFDSRFLVLPESLDDFTKLHTPPEALSAAELAAYLRRLREHGHPVDLYAMLLHSRLAFPFTHLAFALMAIPCALRWPTDRRLASVALATVLGVAYWILNSLALSLGKATLLDPAVAAWAANAVFGGLGAALYARART